MVYLISTIVKAFLGMGASTKRLPFWGWWPVSNLFV